MNFKPLDRYLDTFYSEKNIPGVGISVYRHGRHLHTYCAGFQNVEEKIPFSPDTMVNIYSASKISTCTTAMRLIEKGFFKLDDPVSLYLPEMADVTIRKENGMIEKAENTMLIRHLFSMSAGLSYDTKSDAITKLKAETDGKPTTRQMVKALAASPLLFEPGTHFKYSMCHDVLAAVMEVTYGEAFSSILKKELFDLIGMNNTAFRLTEEQRKNMAPEYHGFNGKTGTANAVIRKEGVDMGMGPVYESGGGGLISCVKDYALLAAALANYGIAPNGTRILTPESIDQMRTNQMNPVSQKDFEEMGGWSKMGYGYGLGVRTLVDRERNNSLSANGEFGWDGALGCYLVADPDTGISIFYAQQEGGSQWWNYHGTIRNIAYACVIGAEE